MFFIKGILNLQVPVEITLYFKYRNFIKYEITNNILNFILSWDKFMNKGGCRRPIEVFLRRVHVRRYISLERSHRVEQLCLLGQSDPRTTEGARRRQCREFFSQYFLI